METKKPHKAGHGAEQQVHFAKSASNTGAIDGSAFSARGPTKGSSSSDTPAGSLSARMPSLASSCHRTTQPQHQEKEILLQHRHVNEMVKAIHSNDHKDPCGRLERAYNDLSKGIGELTSDIAILDVNKSPTEGDGNRRFACAPKEPRVFGPVPGLGGSPPKVRKNRDSNRMMQKAELGNLIPCAAPWGAERANLDKPPWEQVKKHRQIYHKMLDDQMSSKSHVDKFRHEQERNMDRITKTSMMDGLDHTAKDAAIAGMERAVYKELIATVEHRQRSEREQIDAERENGLRLASRAERQVAWQWHIKREEEKQSRLRMAQEWSTAAKQRRELEGIAKMRALREEREVVAQTCQGLVPDRRLRRSRQDCIAALDYIPQSPRVSSAVASQS